MSACTMCGGQTPPRKPRSKPLKYCCDACRRSARREQRLEFVASHPDVARERTRIKMAKWRKTQKESFRSSRRRHYAKRRDEICKQRRELRAADADEARARARRYYAENRERIRARERERRTQEHIRSKARIDTARWRVENYERALESCRRYQRTHPEVVRKGYKRRRARMAGAFVEVVDPRVVFARAKGICGICLTPVDLSSPWEVDHIIPISKGGEHSYANTQLAHRTCNRKKHAKLPAGADPWANSTAKIPKYG